MGEKIEMGAMLIEGKTMLPHSLLFDSEQCLEGWILAKNLDDIRLGRKIRAAGWSYSWTAAEIAATALGFNSGSTTRKAIRRILTKLQPKKFNCLQITQVTLSRFLGLCYVVVSAHPRHIQDSRAFASARLHAVGAES